MNWLAKINLTVVIERLGPFKSALFLIILMVLCLFTGYRLGNFYHHFQTTTLAQQKDRLEYLYKEQALQVERIHTLEVELAVEQLANQDAQVTLKEMAAEHYQAKESKLNNTRNLCLFRDSKIIPLRKIFIEFNSHRFLKIGGYFTSCFKGFCNDAGEYS